jgi:DNA polymerase V
MKPVRMQLTLVKSASLGKGQRAQLIDTTVQAGFPTPAEELGSQDLSLDELLIKRPPATFFMRVQGESMRDAGIFNGDLLVVDRSLEPKLNDIVVAYVDGDFTLKRLQEKTHDKIVLAPENSLYEPIVITGDQEAMIWGVVTSVVHQFRTV